MLVCWGEFGGGPVLERGGTPSAMSFPGVFMMGEMGVPESENVRAGRKSEHRKASGNVLIVEPEELVQWSLVTFLSEAFSVFTADSKDVAMLILNEHDVDAVVIADDITDEFGAEIESLARSRNSDVRVVWTLSRPRAASRFPAGTCAVEKPFELDHLAALLCDDTGVFERFSGENPCSPKTT